MLQVAVNSDNFTIQKPLLAIFGDGFGYTPTGAQNSLEGTEVYRDNVYVSPVLQTNNVYSYEFSLPADLGNFNIGELILLDEDGAICASAANSVALAKRDNVQGVPGNIIVFNVFFDFSTGVAQAFGIGVSSDSPLKAPYLNTIASLPKAVDAEGNIYLSAAPFSANESIVCSIVAGDEQTANAQNFTSWSFSNYQLLNVGRLALGQVVTPYSVVLDYLLPNLVNPGQFILQFAGVVRVVDSFSTVVLPGGISVSQLNFTVPLDTALIIAGTSSYKLYTYIGLPSTFLEFFQNLTVSAQQVNEAALANATLYLRSDGAVPLTSNLNCANFKLTGLSNATQPKDAVNLEVLQTSLSLLQAQIAGLASRLAALEAR